MSKIAKPKGQKELEDEQKKYVDDQGGQAGLETGSPVGPVSSGTAPATDVVNDNPADSNRSGLFTSFEKFKQANLPKAGALGARVGGDYTAAGDTQLQNIQDTSADYGQEVAQNTFQFGDEYLSGDTISGFRDEALGVVDTARAGEDATKQQLSDFDTLSNVAYGGPRDFNALQKSGLERTKRRVDEIGNNLTTDKGRKQQLREHFKPTIDDYSRQASELDNLILKTDPAVQELYNAGSYIDALALDDAYSSALGNAQGLGTSVDNLHNDLRTRVRGDLTDTQSKYYGQVDERLGNLENTYGKEEGRARTYFEDIIENYEDGGALTLSDQELELLGLQEGDLLFNEFQKENLGERERFSRGTAIGENEARKLGELNALSKIAGTDAYGADLISRQAGTFKGNEFTGFDDILKDAASNAMEELQKDISVKGASAIEGREWIVEARVNLANKLGVDLSNPVDVEKWEQQLGDLGVFTSDEFWKASAGYSGLDVTGTGDNPGGDYISDVQDSGLAEKVLPSTGATADHLGIPFMYGGGGDRQRAQAYGARDDGDGVNILQDSLRQTTKTIDDMGLRNVVKGGAEESAEFGELLKYLDEKERLLKEIE